MTSHGCGGMRSAKMRMIAGRPTLIAAVLLHQAVQAQTAQQYALCFESTGAPADSEPLEILISGCTAVIQSGNGSGHGLAAALTNRGLDYTGHFKPSAPSRTSIKRSGSIQRTRRPTTTAATRIWKEVKSGALKRILIQSPG
jgi:hypothetical protein